MQTEQLLGQFFEIDEVKVKLEHCYYSEDINLFCPNVATSGYWAFADWLNGAWWLHQKTHQINGNSDVSYPANNDLIQDN